MSEKILEMTIEELNLSRRAYGYLKHFRIDTVEQLINHTKEDLIKFRLGSKSSEEVIQKLASFGLHLKESPSVSITDNSDWKK